jgi:hypothetical protein
VRSSFHCILLPGLRLRTHNKLTDKCPWVPSCICKTWGRRSIYHCTAATYLAERLTQTGFVDEVITMISCIQPLDHKYHCKKTAIIADPTPALDRNGEWSRVCPNIVIPNASLAYMATCCCNMPSSLHCTLIRTCLPPSTMLPGKNGHAIEYLFFLVQWHFLIKTISPTG